MLRSQKVGCVLLACIVLLEIVMGTACQKTGNEETTSAATEVSETEDEDPSSSGPEASSGETEPEPMDPVEKEAKELAENLGVSEEELHGRYDLFIKYADCIVNNPKLGEWRGYALHYFPIVADYLTGENEEFFLEKVKDLKMISMPIEDAAGDFNDASDMIRFCGDGRIYKIDTTYTTIYHELTHFLDAFVEGEESEDLFYNGDRFAYQDDFTEEEWADPQFYARPLYSSFITEGGAELYMSKYFAESPRAYYCESCFLTGIEWIYGSEALDTLFFSKDSTKRFVDMLLDAGYTGGQICSIFDSFNYETYGRTDEPDDRIYYEDVLVELYEHEKGNGWKDDKVFCQILKQINTGYHMSSQPELKNPEINEIVAAYDEVFLWTEKVLEQVDDYREGDYVDALCVMIRNDHPYLATRVQRTICTDGTEPSAITIEYDFDQGKVLSYEFVIYHHPTEVPKTLSPGAELDERLDSFLHDNAKAHQQTAYAGSSEKKDLYDRACEIGNKYGVYIHVGEDLPEYLERGDVSSAEHLREALDQVEKVLGQFPEGYFDQLNYGYYSGFDIVLCDWPIMDDLAVIRTGDEYLFHVALECRNEKNLALVEERLLDAVFSATDLKMKNYYENFEIPGFSEEKWSMLNPVGFCYSGFLDEDKEKESYENNKEYVATITGMRWAPKDRSQLMTSLLLSKTLSGTCLEKAELYSRAIREAFDDSTWPEETVWEEKIAGQQEESGENAA